MLLALWIPVPDVPTRRLTIRASWGPQRSPDGPGGSVMARHLCVAILPSPRRCAGSVSRDVAVDGTGVRG